MKTPLRIFFISALFFSTPLFVHADTRSELMLRISELRETVRMLTAELRIKLAESNKDFSFDRDLSIGSQGEDVKRLQLFLSLYTQFYPEGLLTGYYGELTNAAVERFKREYDIKENSFGSKTRESLNELLSKPSTFVVSTPVLTEIKNGTETDETAVDNVISTSEIARRIHDGVNRIRAERGLNTLVWDDEITTVALAHAKDQARDNTELTKPDLLCQYPTIRHEGFLGGYLVRDRVVQARIPFRSVGENIAMIPAIETRSYSFSIAGETPKCPERTTFVIGKATDKIAYEKSLNELLERAKQVEPVTFIRAEYYDLEDIVQLAVDGWMDSAGHRENILYPDYTHSGIGVVKINEYYIITHDMVGR